MRPYYIFNESNGLIEFIGVAMEEEDAPEGYQFRFSDDRVNASFEYHNLQTDALQTRPELAPTVNKQTLVADGVDEIKVTGLPSNVTVVWPDNYISEVSDNEITFSVDLPGTYEFKIIAPPHKDYSLTVEAV